MFIPKYAYIEPVMKRGHVVYVGRFGMHVLRVGLVEINQFSLS